MDADFVGPLLAATLASSVAILIVGLLRKPLRLLAGARAAYWLWLLVPALLVAAVLPAPVQLLEFSAESLPARALATMNAKLPAVATRSFDLPVSAAIALWLTGAATMLGAVIRRQRGFVRSLGDLQPDATGLVRSHAAAAPMLVGAWRPKIVIPADFEDRYSAEERELVLAHERAHLQRRDVAVNAAAASWLCLFWFNPLVYWAMGRLRIDQELACDATVLARHGIERRRYADVLLKSQLAADSGWRMPVGCHWHSNHPLQERIAMLKRPLPGTSRRFIGITGALGLAIGGGFAVWAASAEKGPRILVTLKLKVADSQVKDTYAAATQYLVQSGELPAGMDARPYDFACTPFLPNEAKGRAGPVPAQGQILMDCRVRNDGKVVWAMAVLAADGQKATLESSDRGGLRKYKLELSASTSDTEIAAAVKAGTKTPAN